MAILIVPYAVDWTSYKATFEAEAERLLGQRVRVMGRADLSLLPSTRILFTDIRVGEGETPDATIERLSAEVRPMALLEGSLDIVAMTIVRPVFTVDLATLAGEGEAAALRFDPKRVAIAAAEISDARVEIIDSRNERQWTFEKVNGTLEARSLAGPLKFEGGVVIDGRPLGIVLAAGESQGGRTPLKVNLNAPAAGLALSTDGTLQTVDPRADLFAGTFRLEQAQFAAAGEADVARPAGPAVEVTGKVSLATESLSLPSVQIVVNGASPLQLTGRAGLQTGSDPRFDIELTARQIDLDRAFGGGGGKTVPVSEAAAALARRIALLPPPPLPGTLALSSKGLVVGGGVVEDVILRATPGVSGWHIDALEASLPGATSLSASGDLALDGTPAFDGRVSVASRRPGVLASWLHGVAGPAARLDGFEAAGTVRLSASERTFRNIVATVGEGTIRGGVNLQTFEAPRGVYLSMDLSADRLDVDRVEAALGLLGDWRSNVAAIDRTAVKLVADAVSYRGTEAGSIAVDGDLSDGVLTIRRLSVGDFAGTRIDARGRLEGSVAAPRGRMDASVSADSLDGVLTVLRALLPADPRVRQLAAVAPKLAPLVADVAIVSEAADAPLSLEVDGTLAATRLNVRLAGTGQLADPASIVGTADVTVSGDEAAAVLAQVGAVVPDGTAFGPLKLTVRGSGKLAEGAPLAAALDLGTGRATLDGTVRVADGSPGLDGRFEVAGKDLGPLLAALGFAPPGAAGLPADLKGSMSGVGRRLAIVLESGTVAGSPVSGRLVATVGDGVALSGEVGTGELALAPFLGAANGRPVRTVGSDGWDELPIVPDMGPANLTLDLAVTAERLSIGPGVEARTARFSLASRDGLLQLSGLSADLFGGTLSASGTLRLAEASADLALQAALSGASLQDFVWRRGGRPVATGTIDLSGEVTGNGASVSALVASLAGSGAFQIANGELRFLNPASFPAVVRASEAGLALEAPAVEAAFAGHLDNGVLPFRSVAGSFAIVSGVARVAAVSVDSPSATALGSANLDLNDLSLDSEWALGADQPDDEPSSGIPQVGIAITGPIADPTRAIDVAPLLGYLNIRAFEREVERVEQLQTDVLEKDRLQRQMRRQREEGRAREAARVFAPTIFGPPLPPRSTGLALPSTSASAPAAAPPPRPVARPAANAPRAGAPASAAASSRAEERIRGILPKVLGAPIPADLFR